MEESPMMLVVFAALTAAAMWAITAPQSPQGPTTDELSQLIGRTFVFAALAVNAIIWGSMAGTLRQPAQERLATKEVPAAWSMTESVAAPDPSIRVW
jgi:hypothetical protein